MRRIKCALRLNSALLEAESAILDLSLFVFRQETLLPIDIFLNCVVIFLSKLLNTLIVGTLQLTKVF